MTLITQMALRSQVPGDRSPGRLDDGVLAIVHFFSTRKICGVANPSKRLFRREQKPGRRGDRSPIIRVRKQRTRDLPRPQRLSVAMRAGPREFPLH
jgi:hypothetical protein